MAAKPDQQHAPQGAGRLLAVCRACLRPTGTDGAAVSVLSSNGVPSTLCATDAVSASVEDLQFTLGEGPSVDAMRSGKPVLIADLDDGSDPDCRWPVFPGEARTAGVQAVFAFPLHVGTVAVGTLGLYRARPGPLAARQLSGAIRARDRVALRLLDLDEKGLADVPPTSHRMVVHQAAGMVTAQMDVTVEEALLVLRATAYAEGVSIEVVATDVVSRRRRLGEGEGARP
jgi:hypothetical protein